METEWSSICSMKERKEERKKTERRDISTRKKKIVTTTSHSVLRVLHQWFSAVGGGCTHGRKEECHYPESHNIP